MRLLLLALVSTTALAQDVKHGELVFAAHCAGCHGANGAGGELGPNITDGVDDTLFTQPLPTFIRQGVPEAGMPSFATLPARDLAAVVSYITMLRSPASAKPPAGDTAAGAVYYFGAGGCATCHMIRGEGGVIGPDLTGIGDRRRVSRLEQALLHPGSPPREGYRVVSVTLRDGQSFRGLARNESNYDLQLEDLNGQLHYFSRDDIVAERPESTSLMPPVTAGRDTVRDLLAFLSRLTTTMGPKPITSGDALAFAPDTATGDWPTYNGHMSGNRYSPLHDIDTATVHRLAPAWLFPIPSARHLEGTPIVVDGTMFVTTANEAYALDARTGRPVWHYARALTSGVIGDAAGAINRGVAVLGDRVFMVTDHAHLIALARGNGALLWDVEMADYHKHYGATSAPLVVNDLVLSGTSGGDEGDRGFIAAYDARTGRQVWRFSTVPSPGDPAAATWRGRALGHGCAAAWLTGTYDAATGIVYWPTGNPCPDYNGDERQGDNLYSSSVLALEAKTGRLVWYYQYTPHNLHDWDAAQTPMLVDDGSRKLLLQANRNGFFYVLDRVTGHLVLSRPFVHKLTWASGIGADGRPILLPGSDPSPLGTKACPSLEGATNWMSTSFNPSTHLYYVMALEACSIFSKSSAWWTPGQSFYGGGANRVPGEHRQKVLRAINPETGETAWEVPQIGTGDSWGGVLSTAGGVVFYGDDAGALAAVSASTGAPLWHFHTNAVWHASPMTYAVNGHQYIAAAAGVTIIAFALPQ
ncbi:MAG TPA: PQQ-binding-like beta-propeller repeat protein [Gemmatimonadaceae bacterium]|nr:PQQ-binding-like beta-propeller repeat protein [Gemmatimonadaceae bacterium]